MSVINLYSAPKMTKDHPWVAFDAARFKVVESRAIGPTLSTYRQMTIKPEADAAAEGADESESHEDDANDGEVLATMAIETYGPDSGAGGDGLKIAQELCAAIKSFGSIEPWGFKSKGGEK